MLRIGIDVGGTNTDAVVMDGNAVLSAIKAITTEDVISGVGNAMEMAIAASGVARGAIRHVMIGTTHFTNAVVERKHLSEVAAIRLGLPAAHGRLAQGPAQCSGWPWLHAAGRLRV